MLIPFRSAAVIAGLALVPGCSDTGVDHEQLAGVAQIFSSMGLHERQISTDSDEAQSYFNQGLTWMYAFNHDEAIRSFARAATLDQGSAMAWWGVALCEGPNYNDPIMSDERSASAWAALQKARERLGDAAPIERALIEALTQRYAKPWPEDRTDLNQDYAEAMAEVWADNPDDADIGTLYAEALMVRTPWKLYAEDGTPKEDTGKIVAVLERVLEIEPDNPGANHLLIHAVEPSDDPDRGLVAASRLDDMVLASGHLLHMPSHIYVKTGRWSEAVVQNQKAMTADATYRGLAPDQGVQHIYMVHNAHMLSYAAMMSGREQEALAAARAMWTSVPDDALRKIGPLFDKWMCSVYDVQKRFGRWDDLLAEEPPPSFLPITTATWHAHRGVAFAAKQDFVNAELEYEQFQRARDAIPEETMWGRDTALRVLEVSDYFVRGEIALHKGDLERAAELLEQGARVEDTLGYGEPPQWLQPVRHTLGAVYLVAGKFEEAERVYREDLAKWRENGWSLFGLSRALEEQGRTAEAREVTLRYEAAWSGADAPTTTSCKCIPST